MKKVNYIFFTQVVTILSEKGEERVKQVTTKNPELEHDLDFYDRLGIRPPKDLVQNDSVVSEDGFMKLEEGEYTYDFKNRFIDITDLVSAVEGDEFGTVLEFKDGTDYFVEEDLFEVYARIKVAQMSKFEVFKESVIYFFGEIKNKLIKNNKNEE
jgi:hypothetical protein